MWNFSRQKNKMKTFVRVLKMTDDWVSFIPLLVKLLLPLCPRCWNSNNSRPCLVNLIIPPLISCGALYIAQSVSAHFRITLLLVQEEFPPHLKTKPIIILRSIHVPFEFRAQKSIRRQRRQVYSHNNLVVYSIQHVLWWADRLFWDVGEKQLPSRWWRPR